MVVGGSLILGISYALKMYKRRENLKAFERILIYIESEIRYRHSILSVALLNAANKSDEPFKSWLLYLVKRLNDNKDKSNIDYDYNTLNDFSIDDGDDRDESSFSDIWMDSLAFLTSSSCFSKEDLEDISHIGQTLGYLDIEAHKMGLKLEIDNIHDKINDFNSDLKDKMRISVISGAVIGILVVIVLV